ERAGLHVDGARKIVAAGVADREAARALLDDAGVAGDLAGAGPGVGLGRVVHGDRVGGDGGGDVDGGGARGGVVKEDGVGGGVGDEVFLVLGGGGGIDELPVGGPAAGGRLVLDVPVAVGRAAPLGGVGGVDGD